MKHLLSLLLMTSALITNAQIGIFSENIDKAATVDTARYEITYSLSYTCHPDADVRFDDIRTVLIGRRYIKDQSDIIHHYDSLRTADARRGADAFPNPPGSPWPYEILLTDRGKNADMKYRLPIGCGVLHYAQEVPALSWNFIADTTKTIIGYECQLAITQFVGRKYSAWFSTGIPLPYGPYKFGGLPGLILQINDDSKQFNWQATALEKSAKPICSYQYADEKKCSKDEADKTIARCFNTPLAFQLSALGMGKGRLYITGKDGKVRDASEYEDTPIPYIPIEIK